MVSPLGRWRDTLAKYKPRTMRGASWYRTVFHTRRKSVLTMDGAFLYGGRYNLAEEFGALYLSDSPEGCTAELARRPASPHDYIISSIKITLTKVCDLTDETLLADLGLTANELKSDDWTDTQVLGDLVRQAGFEAIIVPSAAGEFNNLVIFMDRLSERSKVTVEDTRPLD